MTLIKSISGIRGTIGGQPGDNLTPPDIVNLASSFGSFLLQRYSGRAISVVVGRDARPSGPVVSALVIAALRALGVHVIDAGLTTTPTVEMAVVKSGAQGGIIITASHNPVQWNALKLLNHEGEFISGEEMSEVLELSQANSFDYAGVSQLGTLRAEDFMPMHIEEVMNMPLVNAKAIASRNFKIALDAVNSSGGIYIPELLRALGVKQVEMVNCNPDGHFAHNPEPLPENLQELAHTVRQKNCDLGIAVDPDVDRLALVCEDGSMFGEEYTLVAVADYVLAKNPGSTVSNLSSTRALRDITIARGQQYEAAAVGEVNVVALMKRLKAVIGGEGNGGIIYPALHYGRDALAGVALFLSLLAERQTSMTALRQSFPAYFMTKRKMNLDDSVNFDELFSHLQHTFSEATPNLTDGLKLDFAEGWVHLRKSNTEPIVRIYAEGLSQVVAEELSDAVMREMERKNATPANR